MSDRYEPMGHAATMLCHDCGAVVYWDKDHDAFHDRIDRLEDRLSPPEVAEPEPDLPNEDEVRKCAVCGEPVRHWPDGDLTHERDRVGHTATLTPPACAECSAARGEWVRWPCEGSKP